MAAENSSKLNQLKSKTYTSTRKNTFTLVKLQSFSISGVISAEKLKKITDVCMTTGIMHTPLHNYTTIIVYVSFYLSIYTRHHKLHSLNTYRV